MRLMRMPPRSLCSPAKVSSWGRPHICRPSSCAPNRSAAAPTSSASDASSTRWRAATLRSRATAQRRRLPPCSAKSRGPCLHPFQRSSGASSGSVSKRTRPGATLLVATCSSISARSCAIPQRQLRSSSRGGNGRAPSTSRRLRAHSRCWRARRGSASARRRRENRSGCWRSFRLSPMPPRRTTSAKEFLKA